MPFDDVRPVRRCARVCALTATAGLTLISGCGNTRTPAPDVAKPLVGGVAHKYTFPAAGVSFSVPAGWFLQRGTAPLVAAIGSGDATIAIWRYPRTEPLPVTPASLAHAQRELIKAAKARDSHLRVLHASSGTINGTRAVILSGTERVAGRLRRVRSTHLYAYGAEVVLDTYAPPSDFHAVDHSVFSPLGRSLKLSRATKGTRRSD